MGTDCNCGEDCDKVDCDRVDWGIKCYRSLFTLGKCLKLRGSITCKTEALHDSGIYFLMGNRAIFESRNRLVLV